MFRISNNNKYYNRFLNNSKKEENLNENLKNKDSKITIVTAYYQIKSKFSNETYLSWMSNFLKIPCNLVIFTDDNSYETIFNMRKGNNLEHKTHIIVKKLEEWYNYKFLDYYRYCHTIDIENNSHTPELYMLWNEKSYFVKEIIEKNPFNSEWFFWTDIGCVRDIKMLNKIYTYPNDDKIINLDFKKKIYIS